MPRQAANPVDLGGRREGEAVNVATLALRAVAADPEVDCSLIVLSTAPMLANITANLAAPATAIGKPYLFAMWPGTAADESRARLLAADAPFCDRLDDAVRASAPGTRCVPISLGTPCAWFDGALVQRMVAGDAELIVGVVRDLQFVRSCSSAPAACQEALRDSQLALALVGPRAAEALAAPLSARLAVARGCARSPTPRHRRRRRDRQPPAGSPTSSATAWPNSTSTC
ncbi:MAG: hypothetical protein U0232_19905 [Thermomicrobiales bacterium]